MSGLVHIYCGEGKGKTTAALGLALRASGSGMKVLILQFLKGYDSSEIFALNKLDNIYLLKAQDNNKFVFQMSELEKLELFEKQTKMLNVCIKKVKDENFDLLILDEILGALETNSVDEDILRNFILNKPKNLELVLTGRHPNEFYINNADYVSRISAEKHPFDKGVKARKGIEL